MFTASLKTAILHSLWLDDEDGRTVAEGDLQKLMQRWLDRAREALPTELLPSVPVLGRTRSMSFREQLENHVTYQSFESATFFWGRVPLDALVAFHGARQNVSSDDEIVDLGTPLETAASQGGVRAEINRILRQTSPSSDPDIMVAMIDEGLRIPGKQPTTYAGRVKQLVTTDVVPSQHAESVLYVLLDGLADELVLKHCVLRSALVADPAHAIGLRCFEHCNTVELMSALHAVGSEIKTVGLPAIVNLSLGSHVGPHDGGSPLEDWVKALTTSRGDTFFFVSAGNEGYRHRHCRLDLTAGRPEPMTLTVGPAGCTELMVEFWWESTPAQPTPAITVSVSPRRAVANFQSRTMISGQAPQSVLNTTDVATARAKRWSLVASYGSMNCLTFALTVDQRSTLSGASLEIQVESTSSLLVHAWLTICADPDSALTGGRREGTLLVPSTAEGVICVSGVDEYRHPWVRSSRGPLPEYGGAPARKAPHVAHDIACSLNGTEGTSYAAPRAAAAAAKLVRNLSGMPPDALGQRLTNSGRNLPSQPPSWNDATGYGPVA